MPIRKDKLQFYHKARITIWFGTSLKIIALQMAEKCNGPELWCLETYEKNATSGESLVRK